MNELPKGWLRTEISNVATVVAGGTPKASDNSNFAEPGEGVAWLTPADLSKYNKKTISRGARDLSLKGLKSSSAKLMPKGTILFSSRAPIGYCVIAEKEIATNQGFKNFVLPEGVDSSYVYYYLKSIKHVAEGMGTGTTFKELSGAVAKTLPFLLAPKNEQIRIANKLDLILARVNKAQVHLDKIPKILKRFRQSVLEAATSGELTKEWREESGVSLSEWEETVFSELSREITVGFVGKMSDKYQSEGVKFLRSQNVRAFRFDAKNLLYISTEFHEKIYKSRLEAGDLAVVRSGAPGTTCVIPVDLGDANCSDLVIVRPNEKLISEFGCIYMNSSVAQKNVKDNQVGVAQQHFNVGSMKLMPISLPTKAEQSEIVRRVQSLFALAEAVEKNYKDSNVKVNRLTQSILAKAFRGELVPQEPNDEPAEKLLSRIQSELEKKPKDIVKRTTKKSVVKNMKLEDAPENYLKNLMPSDESEIQAKELWQDSKMTIDDFYAQLKKELINIEEINNSLDPNARTLKALKE